MSNATHKTFVLPTSIVSKSDLSRLVSELEWVDGEMTASGIRTQSGVTVHLPTLSAGLNDFLLMNQLELTESKVRSAIVAQLRLLKNTAPVVHMTFAVSADRASLQTIAEWLRKEVHPHALITVGLQPGLIAGVYMRTPNHVHDYSLRAALSGSHKLLIDKLDELRKTKPIEAAA